MSSAPRSCLRQRNAARCNRLQRAWASAVRWCGAWQRRFAEEGADGLLRDKTRKPGKPPILAETVARVVALTCAEPPHEVTHWTGRAMASPVGISLTSVQRIWQAHKLQPHRVCTFKRSRDPDFAAKLTDIVGLYMDPPTQAVVLSIDEKSQIQALDRTQPGLPIKPGRCGTMTHDYKRHSTTTLFAALNVLDGSAIGCCMQQHRHEEFIRFLNDVERAVPAGKLIEAVVDNYATHKHPKVKAWLERHPRWTFHFTPTSESWLSAVETFFSVLIRKRIRRGSFHSIVDLQTAINAMLRAQRRAEAVCTDRIGRFNPGQARQTACTVRVRQSISTICPDVRTMPSSIWH